MVLIYDDDHDIIAGNDDKIFNSVSVNVTNHQPKIDYRIPISKMKIMVQVYSQ